MTSEKEVRTLAVIVFLAVIFFVFIKVAVSSVDKNEMVDCLKLKAYSEQSDIFYLTENQALMCERHHVEIDAPVGNQNYEKK